MCAGLLDLLLTAAEQRHATASCNALFVLRNLALAGENKAHFVANPRALPVLVAAACRAEHNSQAGAFAAAALWGLVHQGEKVGHRNAILVKDTALACLLLPRQAA